MDDDLYNYDYDDDDNGIEYGYDSDDVSSIQMEEKKYNILSEADISRLQEDDIEKISNILSISRVDSTALLFNYKWDAIKLQDDWFSDEGRVRDAVGLSLVQTMSEKARGSVLSCRICFEDYPSDATSGAAASCGHRFCAECWRGYIRTSIEDGPGCLSLRCPEPSCGAAVGQDMVDRLASPEDREKYARFLLRSYIEHSQTAKWCPAPGCEFAAEFVAAGSGKSYDVVCRCGYGFCWSCIEEIHRPVDCETVANWASKSRTDLTSIWMRANSKPCPKCNRPIEKNKGCMHMRCTSPCGFEFCWLCLGAWSKHGEQTGGFYACDSYERESKAGVRDGDERERKRAKLSIGRYSHYYERWVANHSSRQKALADLRSMGREKFDKLSNSQRRIMVELAFVTDAWRQIAECRRVLKWTYAYGFYLPEQGGGGAKQVKFFEHLQREAEDALERLHQCAENELQQYIDAEEPCGEAFDEFRRKLTGLTYTTRKYFENLTCALEKGLEDVDDCTTTTYEEPRISLVDEDYYWTCHVCTLLNFENTESCEACGNPAPTMQHIATADDSL